MCSHFLANSDDLTTSVEWITGTDQGRLCSTRRPSLLRVPPAPQILSKKFGLKKKFKKNSSMNTPCIVWVMWSVVERIKGKWNTFAIRVSSGFSQHPKFSPRKLELKKTKKNFHTSRSWWLSLSWNQSWNGSRWIVFHLPSGSRRTKLGNTNTNLKLNKTAATLYTGCTLPKTVHCWLVLLMHQPWQNSKMETPWSK